jgi:hypothetical protein
VCSNERQPVFRKKMSPASSVPKNKSSKKAEEGPVFYPVDSVIQNHR